MIKNLRLIIPILVLVGVLATVFISANSSSNDCTKIYRNDEQVTLNGKTFEAEAATSAQEHQKGLSGRECIGDNQAMLFTFDRPGQYGFWMKDMQFAIDVIWIGADKKIVAIEKDFKPETYPENAVNEKDKPALYVLEVKSGTASELGLQLGTPVSF